MGGLDSSAGLGSFEACALPHLQPPGLASFPCSDAKKEKGACIRVITGPSLLNAPRRMLSLWSRDACHGRLRGLGRCECWVPAAGRQRCLVEPTWRLLGVRGRRRRCSDSQEIPGDRYLLGSLAGHQLNPSHVSCAGHGSSLQPGFPGSCPAGRKKPAAPSGLGRVSVGAKSPVNNSTGFLRSPRCHTASSPCVPPSASPYFHVPSNPKHEFLSLFTWPLGAHHPVEASALSSVRRVNVVFVDRSGQRIPVSGRVGDNVLHLGPAPWVGSGRWEPGIGISLFICLKTHK